MGDRKSALGLKPRSLELEKLIEAARNHIITEEELREQKISFVFGNAPINSGITRESAAKAVNSMRLLD